MTEKFFDLGTRVAVGRFFVCKNIALNLINTLSSKSRVKFKLNEVTSSISPPVMLFAPSQSDWIFLALTWLRLMKIYIDKDDFCLHLFCCLTTYLPFHQLTLMKDLSREMNSMLVIRVFFLYCYILWWNHQQLLTLLQKLFSHWIANFPTTIILRQPVVGH